MCAEQWHGHAYHPLPAAASQVSSARREPGEPTLGVLGLTGALGSESV